MAGMGDRLRLAGEAGPVVIVRDDYGIPHVRAETAADAWLGMGYACAQDRMFQMDYDRRRAGGRWAEVAGGAAVGEDILARRMGLDAAARRDVDAMSAPLRSAFEAYARGVNLVIGSGMRPFEPESTGYGIEPWQPWHSVAAFKVRHVLMGLWQQKLAQARLLARIGPETFGRLETRPPAGSPLAVPPDGRLRRLVDEAVTDVARHLGFLAEAEPGSNAWAVSAARTAHGAAVLCNDSHRALETPNVYWQCQLTCSDFDVIGATFPGLPGFPHFGHNGRVAWAITHADADTQDLYLERFEGTGYLTPDGWREAERHCERINVRGGGFTDIEVFQTRHGPVVHGDPADGLVLALKYTAIYRPDRGFECLPVMLAARDVAELAAAQQGWVDPVNNLVAADAGGRIGYQCRGELPVRSSTAHRGLPVPGWDGECEWVGTVPFGEMPRAIDPAGGFVLTANNVIVDGDEPYISYTFAQPFRAEQIRARLADRALHTTEDLAAMQADTVSWAARAWGCLLAGLGGPDGGDTSAEAAWRMLAGWDGDLAADSARALLYGCFQRALAEELYRPLVGDETWSANTSRMRRACSRLTVRWRCGPPASAWKRVLPSLVRHD